jgi:hypothetical protein
VIIAFIICATGSFALGLLTACILLAAKEDELQMQAAQRCWDKSRASSEALL